MVGNVNNMMSLYQRMRSNPAQMLSQRFNFPQNMNMNDPGAILQYLLNSGQVSQAQVNNVMEMRNNPVIQKMFGKN